MEFFKQNVLLIGLALGSMIALIWPMFSRAAAGSVLVSVSEAVLLMSRQKPLIIDVRDAQEFAQGHLLGARNMPLATLPENVAELAKFKDKPVLVVCQRGTRAKTACGILKAQQFTALHQLQGGMQAWQEAKMPVSKA